MSVNKHADAMSRLPLSDPPPEAQTPPQLVLMIEHLQDAPVTAREIALWTLRDHLLAKVTHYVQNGWPDSCDEEDLKPYWRKQTELSLHEGCILWVGRVVVLRQSQEFILTEQHGGHLGVSRMKAVAMRLLWWPGLDGMVK